MATTAQVFAQGVLTGSQAEYYACPTGTTAIIKAAALINATGGAVDVTVWLNPVGGGTDRVLIDTHTVADEETYLCPELINQVLEAGGTIDALGNGVTIYVSGVEIV